MIRVGLVGYGFAGRGFHAYLIGLVPELQLVAVATRDAARRAQAATDHGVTTYETLDDLLERGAVDLVVIATPHDTHRDLACRALDAGKHVVVDKVMCLTAAEADEMIAARDRNGTILSIFQNRRWDGDYLTVHRALDAGWLDAPFLFESAVVNYRAPRGWRGDAAAGGGILFDWGAHLIDQALQLVPGPVASVTCDIQYRGWGAAIGSYARLLLRFTNGVLYTIEFGNLVRMETPRWRVVGERGALVKTGLDPQERDAGRGHRRGGRGTGRPRPNPHRTRWPGDHADRRGGAGRLDRLLPQRRRRARRDRAPRRPARRGAARADDPGRRDGVRAARRDGAPR